MCLLLMWPSCVHVFASLFIGGCKKAGAPGFMPCHHWLVCAAANGILACWAIFLPSDSDMGEGSRPRFLRWCLQSQTCSYFRITAGFDFNVNVVVDRIVLVLLGSKVPGCLFLPAGGVEEPMIIHSWCCMWTHLPTIFHQLSHLRTSAWVGVFSFSSRSPRLHVDTKCSLD